MKRILFLLSLLPVFAGTVRAENLSLAQRHEIRLGIGDAWLDSYFYRDGLGYPSVEDMRASVYDRPAEEAHVILLSHTMVERGKLHTTGNIFLEYQYRITSRVGVGAELNLLPMWRKYNLMNGYHDLRVSFTAAHLCVSLMPRVRFTWMEQPHVGLYSGIGVGATVQCGLAPSHQAGYIPYDKPLPTRWGAAVDLTLLGVSFGGEHVVGMVELSPMFHLGPHLDWFSAGSRMVKIALGYRF